ncbi:C40 family peptidase [Klebsiella sp. BIGb0407]|uniref:C40 family peptidase n=1 Tax=Klebsiella sp. BIGb0407 TaxID=2940603 RepID=UPI00286D8EDC|nr:C40 family peptidase [Klebsiella sp. BIGb0407]MCS3430161.1 murein DD-endopeptidase [Klebsiella sp. BIGb0407]
MKFSVNDKQSDSRPGKHYNLAELEKKGLRVKVSAGQQISAVSGTTSSSKALVRTGLLKEARLQKVAMAQRPESSFSQQIQRSGQDVEILLRRLTQRPLYHDRYLRTRQIALNTLMEQLGKPYLWGGASPLSGFDCSGLIYFAYKDHIKRPFPRTARGMFHLTDAKIIRSSELEPGDLVFFQIRQDYVDHVGVYIGDNQFIQSPRTGLDIRISKLSDNYWQNHYVGARRVMTPDNIY